MPEPPSPERPPAEGERPGRKPSTPADPWSPTPTPTPVWAVEAEVVEEAPPRDLWARVGDVRPWGTAALVLAWAVVFAVLGLRGEVGSSAAYARWGANLATPAGPELSWRLLAYTFLHGGFLHLFFNAFAMAIFGPAVERVFTPWRFWLLFASGAALSGTASGFWRASHESVATSVSVGASGAIFTLGGALLAAAWKLRHRLPPGRARALAGALLPLVLQGLVSGMTRAGTDNVAHLAGLVWGLAAGLGLGLDPRLDDPPPPVPVVFLGAISAAALWAALVTGWLSGFGVLP